MGGLSPRMDYSEFVDTVVGVAPVLQALSKAADISGLEKPLTELTRLCALQINGYVFCVQLHLNLACKLRVAPAKLDLVVVWRDTPTVFMPRGYVAPAQAEALTTLARAADYGVEGHEYDAVLEHFSRTEVAFLTAAVANIRAWSRIAIVMRFVSRVPVAVAVEQA